jgi:hypothetical protein
MQFPAADVPNKLGKISGAPVHSVYRKFLKLFTLYLPQGSGYFSIHFDYVILILACNYNLILCIHNKHDIQIWVALLWNHVKSVPCHHGTACPQVVDGADGLQIWRVTANILNKQPQTADRGWSSSLGIGRGSIYPHSRARNLLRIVH